jgi:hypothetical protein
MWTYGGEWTAYVEWIEFLRQEAGYERDGRVDYTKWQPWLETTLHGGVRVMHEQFCIVSDRPEFIRMETVNGRGRLHCADGPAKRYRDGWSIYAIHGVQVPPRTWEKLQRPDLLTAEEVFAESNAEIRRVMIDKVGMARLLAGGKAREIARDACGVLWEFSLPDDEPVRVVQVVNSTPEPIDYVPGAGDFGERRGARWFKHYVLRVPPSCATARAAVAWTCGVSERDYAPAVQS